ncbi:MAG: hypothetical protein ACI8RD_007879, partial [Bacillariaceae sp.]
FTSLFFYKNVAVTIKSQSVTIKLSLEVGRMRAKECLETIEIEIV